MHRNISWSSKGGLLAAVATVALLTAGAWAQPPATVNLHGFLSDAAGVPLEGQRVYQVRFFDSEIGGAQLGGDLGGQTEVIGGYFNLPVALPDAALSSGSVWYELAIDTDTPQDGDALDDVFSERTLVHSVPFARLAEGVVSVDATAIADGSVDNGEFETLDGATSNLQSQIDGIDTSGIAQNATDISNLQSDVANKANAADVYTQTEIDTQQAAQDTEIGLKANAADVYTQTEIDTQQAAQDTEIGLKANAADVYTQTEIDTQQAAQDTQIGLKANAADVYTQTEIDTQQAAQDTQIGLKANAADVYTQTEIDTQQAAQDTQIGLKANAADVYTQTEIDTQQAAQDTEIGLKANAADVYTQTEIDTQQAAQDTQIGLKANAADVYTKTEADAAFLESESDTLADVTGRGASTSDAVTLDGGLLTDTVSEATTDAGVAVDDVTLQDGGVGTLATQLTLAGPDAAPSSNGDGGDVVLQPGAGDGTGAPGAVQIPDGTDPPPATENRLYNAGGNLYWDGVQLDQTSGLDVSGLGAGTVDNTEFGYLNGVTGPIQDQLDDKADSADVYTTSEVYTKTEADAAFLEEEADTLATVSARGAATSNTLTLAAGLLTDVIDEYTLDAGVTVDGVLLKDGQITADQLNVDAVGGVAASNENMSMSTGDYADPWQSFTSTMTANVTSIEIFGVYGSVTVTLRIFEGQGTGGTELYNQSGVALGSAMGGQWETVTLDTPVAVESGLEYTFQLDNSGAVVGMWDGLDYADGVNDHASDYLFRVHAETEAMSLDGRLVLNDSASFARTDDRLYNDGGSLYFDGTQITDGTGDGLSSTNVTASGTVTAGSDVILPSSGNVYIGDPDTDGSWRINVNGTDLEFQRRESGSWTTKTSIDGS